MPRVAGVNILYLLLAAALLAAGGAWAWNALGWLRKEPWETAPLPADRIERVVLEERDQFVAFLGQNNGDISVLTASLKKKTLLYK